MKVIRAFFLCWLLMLADGVSAQLVDKVLSVLGEDSVGSVTVARTDSDSIQLSLIRQELEAARLNEANLRMEMLHLCTIFSYKKLCFPYISKTRLCKCI